MSHECTSVQCIYKAVNTCLLTVLPYSITVSLCILNIYFVQVYLKLAKLYDEVCQFIPEHVADKMDRTESEEDEEERSCRETFLEEN